VVGVVVVVGEGFLVEGCEEVFAVGVDSEVESDGGHGA